MTKLTINELIEGEIYKIVESDRYMRNWIFQCDVNKEKSNITPMLFIRPDRPSEYKLNCCPRIIGTEYYTITTNQEKQWMKACIKAKKYVECPPNRLIVNKLRLD